MCVQAYVKFYINNGTALALNHNANC